MRGYLPTRLCAVLFAGMRRPHCCFCQAHDWASAFGRSAACPLMAASVSTRPGEAAVSRHRALDLWECPRSGPPNLKVSCLDVRPATGHGHSCRWPSAALGGHISDRPPLQFRSPSCKTGTTGHRRDGAALTPQAPARTVPGRSRQALLRQAPRPSARQSGARRGGRPLCPSVSARPARPWRVQASRSPWETAH